MKKLICLLMAAILLLCIAACGTKTEPETSSTPPATVSSPSPSPEPSEPAGLGLDDWNPETDSNYKAAITYRAGDTFVKTDEGMVPATLGFEGITYIPLDCNVILNARNLFYIMDAEGEATKTAFFVAKREEGETEGLLEKTADELLDIAEADFTEEVTIENLRAIEIGGQGAVAFDLINDTTHIFTRRYMTNYEGYTYTFQFNAEESKAIADDRGDKIVAAFTFGVVLDGALGIEADPNFKLQKTKFDFQMYIPQNYIVTNMQGDYGIMCYTPDALDKLSLQVAFGPEEPDMLAYTAEDMESRLRQYYPDVDVTDVSFLTIDGKDGIKMITTGIPYADGTETLQIRYGVNYDSKAYWALYVTTDLSGNDDTGDKMVSSIKFGIDAEPAAPDTSATASASSAEEVTDQSYTITTAVYSMKITYTGGWKDGAPNGYGVATAAEDVSGRFGKGDTLSGNWASGLIEGEGEYNSGNFKLVGNFIKGLKEGTVKQYQDGKHIGDIEFENGSPK